MAISTVVDVSRLDKGSVLAPERYDPRRRYVENSGPRVSDIVNLLREQTSVETAEATQQFLVLATGDARDGIIRPTMPPCDGSSIGSTKRRIRPGQVIVSRPEVGVRAAPGGGPEGGESALWVFWIVRPGVGFPQPCVSDRPQLTSRHFSESAGGGVSLNDEGRNLLLGTELFHKVQSQGRP